MEVTRNDVFEHINNAEPLIKRGGTIVPLFESQRKRYEENPTLENRVALSVLTGMLGEMLREIQEWNSKLPQIFSGVREDEVEDGMLHCCVGDICSILRMIEEATSKK